MVANVETHVALISGLIGALASGGLGFGVRLILDKRTQKDAERRLAFVFLVKVSDIVAADIVIRTFAKALVPQEALKEINKITGAFEPSHKLAAMIAGALQKFPREQVESNSAFKAIPRLATLLLEDVKASSLGPEQLSKLPKAAVYDSERFQTLRGHAMQIMLMWGAFIESDDRSWITPEGVHDHWTTLVRFIEAARTLRIALVRFGAATPREATDLLNKQIDAMSNVIQARMADKTKLAAAAAELHNAASEEPSS